MLPEGRSGSVLGPFLLQLIHLSFITQPHQWQLQREAEQAVGQDGTIQPLFPRALFHKARGIGLLS